MISERCQGTAGTGMRKTGGGNDLCSRWLLKHSKNTEERNRAWQTSFRTTGVMVLQQVKISPIKAYLSNISHYGSILQEI